MAAPVGALMTLSLAVLASTVQLIMGLAAHTAIGKVVAFVMGCHSSMGRPNRGAITHKLLAPMMRLVVARLNLNG